jgi:transcriptional regulator with XRE-family HTH domain
LRILAVMEKRTVGDVLRELREDAGISMTELGRRANVDTSTLSRIERGIHRTITLENLARLAQALGTSVTAIEQQLGGNSDQPPPRRRWPTVEEVIERDRELTQIQKAALIAHYRSYVRRR